MNKYNVELDLDNANTLSIILRYIEPNSKVLEFGAAYGRLTKYLSENMDCEVDIVELDDEAGKEASKFAQKTLIGNDLGNIENYTWNTQFEKNSYDYIILADVLEHLRKPEEVLLKCKAFLKSEGRILISMPNIAHNAVVNNLYYDRFDYTEVGLLDDTHLKFWGLNNLEDICYELGYVIDDMQTVEATMYDTEQTICSGGNSEALKSLLEMRPFGNVYQFVLNLKKRDIKNEKHYNLTSTKYLMSIYVDTGEGYSEQQKISDTIVLNQTYRKSFNMESFHSIKHIRVDPVEGIMCKVKSLKATSNLGMHKIVPLNQLNRGEGDYFETTDPMYQIEDLEEGMVWLEIELCVEQISILELTKVREKMIQQLQNKIADREIMLDKTQGQLSETQGQLSETQGQLSEMHERLQQYTLHYEEAIRQRDSFLHQLKNMQLQYNVIATSTSWKMTKPLRSTADILKEILKSNKVTYKCCRAIKCVKQNGMIYTIKRIQDKYCTVKVENEKAFYSEIELEKQRKTTFEKGILFSILVPLYNTPHLFLCEMIESVQAQTYSNWELCMADGSDEQHKFVREIVQGYQKKDKRILYKKLEKNRGISENTNACVEMASGQYLCLFDHDDILHPSALYECMKAIDEKNADFIYTDENTFSDKIEKAYCPNHKPDYAPDTLRSYNYICHFSVFNKDLLEKVGNFRAEFDGSQDYDMILRLTEIAKTIVHIPQILYYWRSHETSVASDVSAKPYTVIAAKKALKEHLQRVGLEGEIEDSRVLSTYRIKYKIQGEPLVSILIPNKDHIEDLEKCINSILERSTYRNYEIIIIENNSELPETFTYYEELCKNERITIKTWTGKFNFSAINNFGAGFAKGEYLILLNNDVEIITPQWIEEMLMFAQREDVGIVGAMLYYPDDTVQHGGVIMGIGGIAGHAHKYFKRSDYGYMSRLTIAQNLSCVTGACLMISKNLFEAIDRMDENLEVAFNDVDLCIKVRQRDYLVVWTPYAELYHHESKSRGMDDTKEKQERFSKEVLYFKEKWAEVLLQTDPYYNPNLTLDREDYTLK